jgi:hypothetical protein
MNTRQAAKWIMILCAFLTFITGCSPSEQLVPSLTPSSPTATLPIVVDPPILENTSTPVPAQLTCLTQPGRVELGKLGPTRPAQEYRIYLPPCYTEQTEKRYPVLYLLHGQTYTSDQWIRLGAVDALDQLILSGASQPFIIVFPDDRYWNLEAGPGFGDRLVNELIPYIDETYRTIPVRGQRAIGGLSRGAGWALRLGLTRWDLFNIIGLHSLAVFQGDGSSIEMSATMTRNMRWQFGWGPCLPETTLRTNGISIAAHTPRSIGAPIRQNTSNGMRVSGIFHNGCSQLRL